MWKCDKCGRIFEKENQNHSCHQIPLENHFKNKDKAKELFDFLVKKINDEIGKVRIISIPCCVHLFGKYDFLAVLSKKDEVEIRFCLDRQLDNPRITESIFISSKTIKYSLRIKIKEEMDGEFMGWVKEAYFLKEKK